VCNAPCSTGWPCGAGSGERCRQWLNNDAEFDFFLNDGLKPIGGRDNGRINVSKGRITLGNVLPLICFISSIGESVIKYIVNQRGH